MIFNFNPYEHYNIFRRTGLVQYKYKYILLVIITNGRGNNIFVNILRILYAQIQNSYIDGLKRHIMSDLKLTYYWITKDLIILDISPSVNPKVKAPNTKYTVTWISLIIFCGCGTWKKKINEEQRWQIPLSVSCVSWGWWWKLLKCVWPSHFSKTMIRTEAIQL